MNMAVALLYKKCFNEYVERNDGKIPLDINKSVYMYMYIIIGYRILDNLIKILEKSYWKVLIRLLNYSPELDEALNEKKINTP